MEQLQCGLRSLNDLYEQYSQGTIDKKQFEGMLFRTILADLKYFNLYRWKKDDCLEFLSWFYPRLSRAIDSYNKNGATFESYISTLLRWSAREYRTRHAIRKTAETAVWVARYPEMYTHENEPGYSDDEDPDSEDKNPGNVNNVQISGPEQAKNPRQLLMLILKCYCYISDDMLERIAPRVGMEKDELKQLIEKIRNQRIQHDEAIRLMKERIHSQYYRCIVYENRLRTESKNTIMYMQLKTKLHKARIRLNAMRKRLAKFRMEATNQQVAEAIGTSKGTVDSSMYVLKTAQKNIIDLISRN